MKASLTLNNKDQLALFYDAPLPFEPAWASVDAEQGEIFIGDDDAHNQTVKLDHVDAGLYDRIAAADQILLIQVEKSGDNAPVKAVFVPLMVSQQS